MKNLILILLAFLVITTAWGQQDKRLKGIEKELNEILEVTKAAGFAVAVVEGDEIIFAEGFGYRDLENKLPVDENTLFAIGSCTKAFTSSLLGKLRAEDKLSFDDSPVKYVQDLKFYNDEMNNNITIADLMCHRTGLPRHDLSWYLFPSYNKDSLIQRIEFQEPFTGLRQQWYYNNFMFLLQGVIAERISGKSWEDNIREQLFIPLEMTRSNLSIAELENSTNAAVGYELKHDSAIRKMDYYRIAGMAPAGSINSSVKDMSNWLIAWINKGKFNDSVILPKEYVNEAIGSQMVVSPGLPTKENPDIHMLNYGYGWFISSHKGHYIVGHGGNIDGFSARTLFFPSDSIGIVVLANQNRSSVPGLVSRVISDRMLKVNETDWVGRYIEQMEKASKTEQEAKVDEDYDIIKNTRPSHILMDYKGSYSNPGYGSFIITLENDSLFANFKLRRYYLKHVHYDVFEPLQVTASGIDTTDDGNWRFNFLTNNSGSVSSVKINVEPMLDDIEFEHVPDIIDLDLATLEMYVGDYEIAGGEVKIYIKNESVLFLFVEGQPEYELVPGGKHTFNFKTLEGFKVEFIESDDQTINELILLQPHGNYKAVKK